MANHILANEGVLDAFGHVSLRHPHDPGRYLLARARSPQLVEPSDFIEYGLDSQPARAPDLQQFVERVIHGCIYQARPDVMAVCHHHAPAVMPFCIAGVPIVPVFHLGATGGASMPFWNQRDEFGDTNLLVARPEEGRSLARALGAYMAVLMNNHGATVVGTSLRDLVSRSIFICQNAVYQLHAHSLGKVAALTPGETRLAAALGSLPNVTGRTWEYWSVRAAGPGNASSRTQAKGGSTRRTAKSAGGRKPARRR